ncbi:hypothetical protein AAMO2058_000318000 [Amorphochlora amoebiformis]
MGHELEGVAEVGSGRTRALTYALISPSITLCNSISNRTNPLYNYDPKVTLYISAVNPFNVHASSTSSFKALYAIAQMPRKGFLPPGHTSRPTDMSPSLMTRRFVMIMQMFPRIARKLIPKFDYIQCLLIIIQIPELAQTTKDMCIQYHCVLRAYDMHYRSRVLPLALAAGIDLQLNRRIL